MGRPKAFTFILTAALGACGTSGQGLSEPNEDRDATVPYEHRDPSVPPKPQVSVECDPSAAFGAPLPVDGLGTFASESQATLERDELTLYFSYEDPSEPFVELIAMATRPDIDAPFSSPRVLYGGGAGGLPRAFRPSISGDGLNLAFLRLDVTTAPDLMLARRASVRDPWPMPQQIAGGFRASFLHLGSGEENLYWGSVDPFQADELFDGQIVVAPITSIGPGSEVEEVPGINTEEFDEFAPVISADGLEIFWAIDESSGLDRVRHARRSHARADFVPDDVARGFGLTGLRPTWYSPDRCRLYLTRVESSESQQILMAEREP